MKPEIKQRIEQIKSGQVPNGYKRTKAGIMPCEWCSEKEYKAKDVFKSVTNKKHNGEFEVLSATQDKGVIPRSQVDIDIKFNEDNIVGYKKVDKGDFVISLRSFQGGIEYSEYEGLVSPAYTVLKPKIPICDGYYKAYLKTVDYISRLNKGTYGIRDGKQIGFEDFGDMIIHYPSLVEQEKIAEILSAQDKVIELKEKLLEEKKKQKKYLMQQLLTGKKRLPGFSGEWKEQKLKEFIIEHAEKTTIANQYPVLTSARSRLMYQTEYYTGKQVTTEDNVGYNVIPYGYITFRSRSDDGRFKFNKNTIIEKGMISYFYPVFTFNSQVDADFMIELLNFSIYKKIFKYVEGTAQQVLSLKKLGNLKYNIPVLSEQRAISKMLLCSNEEISLLENVLEQEKQKKKALMQLLLTGIVRVDK